MCAGTVANPETVKCAETHPTTGDVCKLDAVHSQHSDAQVKQHQTATGLKWPTLHELDPHEGYNDYVTRGV
jgi:hypothetical protein